MRTTSEDTDAWPTRLRSEQWLRTARWIRTVPTSNAQRAADGTGTESRSKCFTRSTIGPGFDNAHSCVVRIEGPGGSALLTGDLERGGERALVARSATPTGLGRARGSASRQHHVLDPAIHRFGLAVDCALQRLGARAVSPSPPRRGVALRGGGGRDVLHLALRCHHHRVSGERRAACHSASNARAVAGTGMYGRAAVPRRIAARAPESDPDPGSR